MFMDAGKETTTTTKDFSPTFECLGVDLGDPIGHEAKADCPFCGKQNHFYVSTSTGKYDCKVCGKEGNHFTFLRDYVVMRHEKTTKAQWEDLAMRRGIPASAFKEWGVGYNPPTKEWLIPVFSDRGTVRDVRRWDGKRMKSTTGCNLHLFGLYELANAKGKKKKPCWLMEGESDAIAMKWLLKTCGRDEIVTAVPGAGTFKKDWINWYMNLDVIFMFDNDAPGDEGSLRASKMTASITKRQRFLCWPELVCPRGWDVRDHVLAGLRAGKAPIDILGGLEALLSDHHRRETPQSKAITSDLPQKDVPPPPTFAEVLKVFGRWVKLDRDFKDALAIAYATHLSTPLPGPPLWFYIVGVPGSGKGVILGSLAGLDGCAFHSSLTAASLVSGFNAHPDPSLLPRLNGRTAVFKDGTELLAIHPEERKKAYATLRGAFDGRVDREFGNGVNRKYTDLHFSVLVGITPAIHADNESSMGERFLKVEMREQTESLLDKLYKASDDTFQEIEAEKELQAVSTKFVNRHIEPSMLPKISDANRHRLVAMSMLIAMLRAQVFRDQRDRDLKFRAFCETGTRVVKQMTKLARVLSAVFGKTEMDDEVCRVLRKVMSDSCVGFHIDIVKAMIRAKNQGLSSQEIAVTSKIGLGTVYKRLEDMEDLNIIRSERHAANKMDLPVRKFFLTNEVAGFWEQSLTGRQIVGTSGGEGI